MPRGLGFLEVTKIVEQMQENSYSSHYDIRTGSVVSGINGGDGSQIWDNASPNSGSVAHSRDDGGRGGGGSNDGSLPRYDSDGDGSVPSDDGGAGPGMFGQAAEAWRGGSWDDGGRLRPWPLTPRSQASGLEAFDKHFGAGLGGATAEQRATRSFVLHAVSETYVEYQGRSVCALTYVLCMKRWLATGAT